MSNKQNEILSGFESKTISVGHGNYVVANRIVAIMECGASPMKRLREKAVEKNLLLDATAGRKTRSMCLLDSGHVVLSALAPNTLQERLEGERQPWMSRAQFEMEEGELVS